MGWFDGLMSGIGNFANSAATGIGGALSSFKPVQNVASSVGVRPMPAQSTNWMSNMGGMLGNLFGGGQQAPQAPQAQPGGYRPMVQSPANQFSGITSGRSTTPQSMGGMFAPGNVSSFGGVNTGMGRSTLQPNSLTGETADAKPGLLQQLLGWGKNQITQNPGKVIGGAMSLFGGTKTPPNQVPELNQSPAYQQMSKNAMSGGSPMSLLAQSKLSERLNQTQEQMGQPEIDAITRSLEADQAKELDQMNDYYKSIRPGSDPIMDSTYQRDLQQINDKYARAKADAIAQAQRGIGQNFENNRIRQITAASGLDQASNQQLAQVAGMDIEQMMLQFNISREDAINLKQYFTATGNQMAFGSPQGLDPRLLDMVLSQGAQ